MPNRQTREPFQCRGPQTKNDRVFGPRAVFRVHMAASNDMRVTPSHSMQPTTSLHQWIVHTPTYGRSVSSKPAGFGSYERPKSPWCVRANRVPCGGKYAVGVDRGISDSPRQLVNQLQRDTACITTDSRSICVSAAAARRHGHAGPCCCRARIECSAAVYRLYK